MLLTFVLSFGIAGVGHAQTLAERVAQEKSNISVLINVEVPDVTLEQILRGTSRVVRGVIGQSTSHLTPDGRDIYTTYEVVVLLCLANC